MILMAWSNAICFIAQRHSTGEYWGGQIPDFSSSVHFLARFVTHFIESGYYFIMGDGMILFDSSHRRKGWKEADIWGHLLLRGLVLIAL